MSAVWGRSAPWALSVPFDRTGNLGACGGPGERGEWWCSLYPGMGQHQRLSGNHQAPPSHLEVFRVIAGRVDATEDLHPLSEQGSVVAEVVGRARLSGRHTGRGAV